MATMERDRNCPICGEQSKEIVRGTGSYKEYVCDECGHYLITHSAEAEAVSKDGIVRRTALATARRAPQHETGLPMIEAAHFL